MSKRASAVSDFTISNMPHTRKQVFFDVIKLHFYDLLKCGLLLLLFALPLIASQIYTSLVTTAYTAQAELLEGEELLASIKQMLSFQNTIALIDIACWCIFAVGLSGVARIIRQYAWVQNVSLRYDFTTGIKQNVWQYLFVGLIVGVGRFVVIYIQNQLIVSGGVETVLLILPPILIVLIFVPILCFALTCSTIYNNSFLLNLRIGASLYGRNLWQTLVTFLCCALPLSIAFIPNVWCKIVGLVFFLLFLPTIMVAWWLFSYHLLDKHINVLNHKELIGKGTFAEH